MNIYKEELIDHFKNPRNYGLLDNPNIDSKEYNPSCGDSIQIQAIIIKDNIIDRIGFTGKGCILSQSAASLLTEFCIGKNLSDVLKLESDAIISRLGLNLGPVRIKCALMSLNALKKGIIKYMEYNRSNA